MGTENGTGCDSVRGREKWNGQRKTQSFDMNGEIYEEYTQGNTAYKSEYAGA